MAPEYGATTGFWPVDEQTIAYLLMTGRSSGACRAGGSACASGRSVPHGRCGGSGLRPRDCVRPRHGATEHRGTEHAAYPPGYVRRCGELPRTRQRRCRRDAANDPTHSPKGPSGLRRSPPARIPSNPHGMIRAGLVAKAAVERGLKSAPWVKTSLAPGSRAVTTYLDRAGLLAPLEALGFAVIGYGCTTCAGKSGPLKPIAASAVEQDGRTIAAVLSGNRNFDGRIHRLVGASYLCSPALVVAFALVGRVTARYRQRPDRERRQWRPRLPARSLAGRCRGRCRCPADRHFRSLHQHRAAKSSGEGELGRA